MSGGVLAAGLGAPPVGAFARGLSSAPTAPLRLAPTAAGPSAAASPKLRIGSFNVENFFDTVDNPQTGDTIVPPEQYAVKLEKLSRAIREKLGSPDVLALQEVENQRVLDDLLALPEMKALGYQSVVGALNDKRGICNALLYRSGMVEVTKVDNFNPEARLDDNPAGQVDMSRLYARPPLVVDLRYRGAAQAVEGVQNLDMTVIVNHFKSKLGGDKPEPRRQLQGEALGGFVDARRAANPSRPVIVTGDLNALYEDGAYRKLASRPDGSKRLWDTPLSLKKSDRYTYIHKGNKNMLDHMLVTPDLQKAHVKTEIEHFNSYKGAGAKEGDAKVADGVSDHDTIVATFDLSRLASPPKGR